MIINYSNTGYIDLHSTITIGEIAGLRSYFLLVAHHRAVEHKIPIFKAKDLKEMVTSSGHEWPPSMGAVVSELKERGLIDQVDRGAFVLTDRGCEEAESILGHYVRAMECGHAAFGPRSTNRRTRP